MNQIRNHMNQLTIALAAFLLMIGQAYSQGLLGQNEPKSQLKEYLTFTLSDKVTKQNVQYKNRYGIPLAAHLYTPKNMDASKKYPALVVGTPYGGVKEQGAGIYAQNMAERGFVALAFDESYNGESGGAPRHVSSPDVFAEDFSAGVDFLGTRPFVDRNQIGAIGLCGSGGFALKAAQVDHRIKAVATTSMYDISGVKRNGWMNAMTAEERTKSLNELARQRWKDVDTGQPELTASFPSKPVTTIPAGMDPIASEFFEYYAMKRGFHPNSIGAFTKTSDMDFMNFPLLNYIETISPRPILLIIGEKAHSRYFSEEAYQQAAEPKELYIVPNARHIDLYDRTDMIPFDKLTAFFSQYLAPKPNEKANLVTESNK
ncbi:alpha/beta hydrolase [Spirosoma foliorum]|nr:alpha/beta hydrolase [Spirosoma foliorum]